MGYVEELRELVGTRPLIIVGSAIIVINEQHQVLLQLRSDTHDWGIPGGAMELGETIDETAARELLEETGLKGGSLRLLGVMSGKDLYYKYPHGDEIFNVIHVFQADYVTGVPTVNSEGIEVRYFPIEKLPKLNETTEKILNKFLVALTE